MIRGFHLADVFTLGNAACGVAGVLMAMRYLVTRDPGDLLLAAAFAPAAFLFDVLDGRIARWRHTSSALGRELDSLADVISFGVAPAALAYAAGMTGLWDAVILVYFVCCGVSRLARYNVTAESLSAGSDKVALSKARRSRPACCDANRLRCLAGRIGPRSTAASGALPAALPDGAAFGSRHVEGSKTCGFRALASARRRYVEASIRRSRSSLPAARSAPCAARAQLYTPRADEVLVSSRRKVAAHPACRAWPFISSRDPRMSAERPPARGANSEREPFVCLSKR